MPVNSAAWLTGLHVSPLEVKPAVYTSPGANEIVIKTSAVAINPVDWIVQKDGGGMMYGWLKAPDILGYDVAGEVVEVGAEVTRLHVGDRVIGFAVGVEEKYNTPAKGGFQNYVVLLSHMVSSIPASMSYESAVVMPLGLATAATGLFQGDQLGLPLPSVAPVSQGKTLLVWGGSTSVGCNAIQLGVAAGYEVITTASPKNFDYLKQLGADQVFDYNSTTVIPDIIQALKGRRLAGAFSIGVGAADACFAILDACAVGPDRKVSMASYPLPSPPPTGRFATVHTIVFFMSWMIKNWIRSKAKSVKTSFIVGGSLVFTEDLGKKVFEGYLPQALEQRVFVPAPEPLVMEKRGLEYVQAAMDRQKAGVSAKKVVLSL